MTNFEEVTKSPGELAQFIMYDLRGENQCLNCPVSDCSTDYSCAYQLEEWLKREVKK